MFWQNHCLCCTGSGVCLHCEGWGSHWSVFRDRTHRELCRHCSGTGACAACEGRGRSPGAGLLSGLLRWWRPLRRAARVR